MQFENEALRKELLPYGSYAFDGTKTTIKTKFSSAITLHRDALKLIKSEHSNDANQREYLTLLSDDRRQFAGGTTKELTEKKGLKKYKKLVREISQSKLARQLEAKVGNINQRRRTMSEFDGEWLVDRKYDLAQFSLAKQQPSPTRVIAITADLSFNCSVKAKDIEEYGILCAAICGLLESKGYCVAINVRAQGQRYMNGGPQKSTYELISEVKKPGEYVTPMRVMQAFSPGYLRRVFFSQITIAADLHKKPVIYSLGSPINESKPITFSKGKIGIHNIIKGAEGIERVTEAILEAIS